MYSEGLSADLRIKFGCLPVYDYLKKRGKSADGQKI
jgi:hypothetical protein